ncbi:LacI family DNA-binding transcriptional regulator [Microbulbifer spongiae]|uniref:LacI family DNA-binding transcriptional regulator n=1 Tax=Microbulbifer spongiae TaxID=2944933 RepID=A0ABY9EDH6_9GAMM|nr:LacI family DNA-binding transcriptional regulator [Microbulbifer sp. MI-G]WKD50697.1 LacI family DNA-binding transcriptional regulator [Microbulbifer sp. MI-G]
MKVTINDVAKRAGVSIKTVSRVINNEPSVRPTTRTRVRMAIQALDYRPNLAARNLAGTHSYSIALIYDNPNAYYVMDLQNGILAACRARGYELLIHPSSAKSPSIHDELHKLVEQSRIAGLILTPPFSEFPELMDTLEALDVKFVRILSAQAADQLEDNCIQVNDADAAFSITRHLVELGHRRIGYLYGGIEHFSTLGRLEGYLRALQAAELPVDDEIILEGEYSFDSGVAGATTLLESDSPPTALFAGNDEIAAGALFAARMMNIEVPQQLSIAGFEDSPFSRQTCPKLTTAHQPNEEIGRCAAELALERIHCKGGMEKEKPPESITRHFTPRLIVRDSTGAAPKQASAIKAQPASHKKTG